MDLGVVGYVDALLLFRGCEILGRVCDCEGVIELAESLRELAAKAHPFCGFEVGVLEKEHHGCGAEHGGVLAVELGLAELGRSVGRRLCGWKSGYRWCGCCHLLN